MCGTAVRMSWPYESVAELRKRPVCPRVSVPAFPGVEVSSQPPWSDSANQVHEVFDLFCDPCTVRTEVLLQANSAEERDDQAC
jgi:hypothetical protein